MPSDAPPAQKPWIKTPCIRSAALSREAGCNIYLKLENLQPSGSFKSRGIGHAMSLAISRQGASKPIRFYCSSGGNAGLACATAAIALQRPATIVVPTSSTPLIVEKLKALGADVVQTGRHWSEADEYLREELLVKDENGVYVHPFDHEDVWAGHESLIEELEEQLAGRYDAVVCSVGGGGLFCGIMAGLQKAGRLDGGAGERVKVLGMETEGADSFAQALRQGEPVTLPAITSIATHLGAARVCQKAFEWGQRREVTSCVVSDAVAALGCVSFADDERMLVEPACGVNVAPVYGRKLAPLLFPELSREEFANRNIVIVVCGGSNITLRVLERYRDSYVAESSVRNVGLIFSESSMIATEKLAKVAG